LKRFQKTEVCFRTHASFG